MFIYTYASHEDEAGLCSLELCTLLGQPAHGGIVASRLEIPAGRSPFVKRRIAVSNEADSLEELAEQLVSLELSGRSFKVLFTPGDEPFSFEEQRQCERIAGAAIRGKADMRNAERLFGLTKLGGRWRFGPCEENGAVWLKHQDKPQNYSTALPTRAARAIVNLAAGPVLSGKRLIDPCCGMGTSLIEALSMGISIVGIDINPLAVRGARNNLAHFGYSADTVRLGDLRQAEGHYDAAVVDMPYNLCSVLPEAEQLELLAAVRRLADKAVIVTTERIPGLLERANWRIAEDAKVSKGSFTRYITVVK
ncbi:methyltransferase domain-containing protein [Paenibacillus sp. N4]|uniref:TRM11 family SAM-dependent methyltransferase n=1 Tax=Paenibacillus vietnamensis TaxID=2590547 RepID=UPI001CD0D526|nr:methyltransferase domain-containing protein [Paenibacillus vietnamensis]MCA0756664.1 methyltransferase domain-containing protein [Paenibacillus vietnamensis]